jgi:hypothetical protein
VAILFKSKERFGEPGRSADVITQLNPPLHLETPKGPGWAHFVIDYGPEGSLMWLVFMDNDGACWTVPNFEVRMTWNWSLGRRKPADRAPVHAAAKSNGSTVTHEQSKS